MKNLRIFLVIFVIFFMTSCRTKENEVMHVIDESKGYFLNSNIWNIEVRNEKFYYSYANFEDDKFHIKYSNNSIQNEYFYEKELVIKKVHNFQENNILEEQYKITKDEFLALNTTLKTFEYNLDFNKIKNSSFKTSNAFSSTSPQLMMNSTFGSDYEYSINLIKLDLTINNIVLVVEIDRAVQEMLNFTIKGKSLDGDDVTITIKASDFTKSLKYDEYINIIKK